MKIRNLFEPPAPVGRSEVRPYIIAEAGVNHEGDLRTAERLIVQAADGGADAIKFQTYRAETLASKNSPSYWDTTKEPTKSQYQLFKKYDSFWKTEFEQLKVCCDKSDIEFMSTPFDTESAIFLNDLMDVFKISSSDITNKPFIEYMAEFGKPIILSTGASDVHEIDEALSWIAHYGNQVAILHCVLNYPTAVEDANLLMITDLKERYPDNLVGYSDHTLPSNMDPLITSVLLGAQIIEKHFTHDKSLPGNDHYHAMDESDLREFHRKLNWCISLLGDQKKKSLPTEEVARRNARRSLVAACDIKKGTRIGVDQLTWKRPGTGISPKEISQVQGKVAKMDIKEDQVLDWDHLE